MIEHAGLQSFDVELSLIVPIFNEAEACDIFFETVEPILESAVNSYEIICINDGSGDGTMAKLASHHKRNPAIKVVNLTRNFGKEAAMTAGIDLSSGQAVIPIDVDLQDPPELIPKMLEAWRDGAQVVLARRTDRSSDSALKRLTSDLFYRVISRLSKPSIPKNVGDYRLIDRIVVDALKQLPERSRFMKGLFAWVGYEQVTIDYVRPERKNGNTKFNYMKLWNFALDGIFSFSSVPLKIWSYFGFAVSVFATLYIASLIIKTLVTGVETPGYASTISIMMFFNGIILISLGAIGEYISRIFVEVKQRPIYLINELQGFGSARSVEQMPTEGGAAIQHAQP